MNSLMNEYTKRWYLLVACVVLLLPGMLAGFMITLVMWASGFNGLSATALIVIFGLVVGIVATLPIQVLHISMCKRGVSKLVLVTWSAAWIAVFSLIGVGLTAI